MIENFVNSNLSKIKPKLRTNGIVSGNFGRPKSKAGSPLKDIGVTKVEVVNITTPDAYINRLIDAYNSTNDQKLKSFIQQEIKKIKLKKSH